MNKAQLLQRYYGRVLEVRKRIYQRLADLVPSGAASPEQRDREELEVLKAQLDYDLGQLGADPQ